MLENQFSRLPLESLPASISWLAISFFEHCATFPQNLLRFAPYNQFQRANESTFQLIQPRIPLTNSLRVKVMTIDQATGVKMIEGTLKQADKSGQNLDDVIRQEYIAMAPNDRRAAMAQITKDRATDPSLPGLEITENGGNVNVKSDTKESWSNWGKEQIGDVQRAGLGVWKMGGDAVKQVSDGYDKTVVQPFDRMRDLVLNKHS